MGRLDTWKSLQRFEKEKYIDTFQSTGTYRGFFSIPEYNDARCAGDVIAETCGTCLDIGCGVLPKPTYMQCNFVGIDPFYGEHKRQFLFAQAIGEHIPFADGSFECASFMSSLDHCIDPMAALIEASRILTACGTLFVWTELRPENDHRYLWWKNQPAGTLYNDHHQHAFTAGDIRYIMSNAGFTITNIQRFSGDSYFPPTYLFTGHKQ